MKKHIHIINFNVVFFLKIQLCASINNISLDRTLNVKVEPPTFDDLREEDANAAESLLEDSYENCDDDDDEVLILKNSDVPVPIAVCSYEVKKNDNVSANKPFATNVSILIFFMPSLNFFDLQICNCTEKYWCPRLHHNKRSRLQTSYAPFERCKWTGKIQFRLSSRQPSVRQKIYPSPTCCLHWNHTNWCWSAGSFSNGFHQG